MAGEITLTAVGNLTADPELRYTQAGVAVANFTIAQTARVYDKTSGQYTDGETTFLRAAAWNDLGEHVAASLTKGTRIIASGLLRQKSYEDKNGEKRSAYELEVVAIGPELRFATAAVERASRKSEPAMAGAPGGARHGFAPGATKADPFAAAAQYGDETPF